MSRRRTLSQRLGGRVAQGFFEALAATRALPMARPERHGVEVLRDLPYLDDSHVRHRLDIYRPIQRSTPCPVVLYIHGGGFRTLSKETHWLFGLAWARRGYLVVMPEYRLAPRHPYPAAIEDVVAALHWTRDNAAGLGGAVGPMLLAGESAGANLALCLYIAAHFERPEPWACALLSERVDFAGAAPACGILQVSNPERFWTEQRLHPFIRQRIAEVSDAYLPPGPLPPMADPLCVLEQCSGPVRPLPPVFAPVGSHDPIASDTWRLGPALTRHGAQATIKTYDRGMHAFHAFVWREQARICWRDMLEWSDRVMAHVPPATPTR